MSWLDEIAACLRFWSRLPVPAGRGEGDWVQSMRALPVAALVIALPASAVLIVADAVALPTSIAAILALATLVLTTGALHEDGLADTADGLFGGATRERRLEIMRDSRIGTFGALALGLSVLLRAAALDALLQFSVPMTVAALLATAACSRTCALLPLILLPPARSSGLGAGSVAFQHGSLRTAGVLAAATLLLPIATGLPVGRTVLAGVCAIGAAYVVVRIARARIGGQTGDIAGATQQCAEIACLVVFSGAGR